jgi:hypothetical protein
MKRKQEPEDQETSARNTALLRLNARLVDKGERERMGVLPAVNFGRLVAANRERMCWAHPQDVFAAAGVEPVRMNTAAVRTFLDEEKKEEPALAALYEELFVTHIRFVPWAEFLDRFTRVVEQVVAAVARQREETHPRRLTLLALGLFDNFSVAKSNAWLTGFAWPLLASVVDYVVDKTLAINELARILNDPAFEFDVIYVDDMIYSGNQAGDRLFPLKFRPASRMHVYLAVPFVGTAGAQLLVKAARRSGSAALYTPAAVTIVPSYRSLITPIPLEDQVANLPRAIGFMMQLLRHPETNPVNDLVILPGIVFEHKMADNISVPDFVSANDVYKIGLPPLVLDPMRPFYKSITMKWRMYKEEESAIVREFATIDARLFATLLAAPYTPQHVV